MTSPPNKTLAEARQAEITVEAQHQAAEAAAASAASSAASNAANKAFNNVLNSTSASSSSSSTNGGKYVCNVCKKDFPTNALLNIHTKIHYFERPYKCEACSVSFRTHGHLQKHKRSSGHFNKVNINETFGAPSSSNPRPFYCGDCKIGFRIHGHLAKHLRSKSHIMKLENSGKLPIGMFAEMERLGTNLNEIDTSDCETSLASLKQMAARLCKNKEITVDASNTNGILSPHDIEVKEEPLEQPQIQPQQRKSPPEPFLLRHHGHVAALNLSIMPTISENSKQESLHRRASFSSSGQEDPSEDSEAENGLVKLNNEQRFQCNYCPQVLKDLKSLQIHNFIDHHQDSTGTSIRHVPPPPQPKQPPQPLQPQLLQHQPMMFSRAVVQQPPPQPPQPPQPLVRPPQQQHQVHPNIAVSYSNGHLSMSREGSISSDSGEGGPLSPVLKCELCGLSNFTSTKALQQVQIHLEAKANFHSLIVPFSFSAYFQPCSGTSSCVSSM